MDSRGGVAAQEILKEGTGGTLVVDGVNPEADIAATLRKILGDHRQSDIAGFMPWNFREWSTHMAKGGQPALSDLWQFR